MAQVLGGGDLDSTNLCEVRFKSPAEKAGEAVGLVLKLTGSFEVLDTFGDRFVEANDHGCGRPEPGRDNS